jgi:fatty acid desaturase
MLATMNKNEGTADRIIRIAIAAIIATLYFMHVISGSFGLVLLILSGVLAITSIAGICPLYMLLGLSTKKK